MVMPYHLHMPSYFLETFTEYPFLQSCHWEDWLSQALSQPCLIEDDSAGIGGFHLQ